MRVTVKVPKVDDTTEEVLVTEWLVDVGEDVSEGQPLLVVEGDKIEMELPSPVSGRLTERLAKVEDEVAVGAAVAIVET